VLALSPEQPLVTQVRELRSGVSELIVCARDRHGLYGDVAGSITSAGINILGSHVYTTRGGIALEIYRVNTPDGGEADRRERWLRFTRNLENVLAGTADLHALLQAQRRPLGQRSIPGPVPASVSVRNDVSDFYTVIDVTADDRLGLLYDLARTMAEKGLAISVSKATTVLDQIADTFYVTTAQGGRVAPGEVAALQRALFGRLLLGEQPRRFCRLVLVAEESADAARATQRQIRRHQQRPEPRRFRYCVPDDSLHSFSFVTSARKITALAFYRRACRFTSGIPSGFRRRRCRSHPAGNRNRIHAGAARCKSWACRGRISRGPLGSQ